MALLLLSSLAHVGAAVGEGAPPPPFRLHSVFSDNMVLQAEAPTIYGMGTPGSKVVVSAGSEQVTTTVAPGGNWVVHLKPRPASPVAGPGIQVVVTGAAAGESRTLTDVLFGDLWVCGGQSNMEFSVAEAFDSERIIATSDIPGLRLYAVQKNESAAYEAEPIDLQYPEGWVKSSPKTVCGAEYFNDNYSRPGNTQPYCGHHCGPSVAHRHGSFSRKTWGYFSAVCFIYGRALLRETGRPQGMIESCWGGSPIEQWASDATMPVQCPASAANRTPQSTNTTAAASTTAAGGSMWNGMLAPFNGFPIRGAIWYQGESNAGAANRYACQMRHMIEGWRHAWQRAATKPLPPMLADFTFVLHQLSACTYHGNVPALRWSQQGAVAPWTSIPNTAMSVGLDLYDAGSPCANVHIRNKTAVGERMAQAALAIAYGRDISYTGPVAARFALHGAGGMIVTFNGSTPPLRFLSIPGQTVKATLQGFEVLQAENGSWSPAAATIFGPDSVHVALPPSSVPSGRVQIVGIRYAWQSIPCTQLLFDSTRINSTSLFGLPAPPFWANCTSLAVLGGCELIIPGHLPVGGGGGSQPHPLPPPSPPSTLCPRPALPVSGPCVFTNNSAFGESAKGTQHSVKLNDYGACCALCKADAKCTAAAVIHGPRSAEYDFCYTYTSPLSSLGKHAAASVCPVLAVTLVPA